MSTGGDGRDSEAPSSPQLSDCLHGSPPPPAPHVDSHRRHHGRGVHAARGVIPRGRLPTSAPSTGFRNQRSAEPTSPTVQGSPGLAAQPPASTHGFLSPSSGRRPPDVTTDHSSPARSAQSHSLQLASVTKGQRETSSPSPTPGFQKATCACLVCRTGPRSTISVKSAHLPRAHAENGRSTSEGPGPGVREARQCDRGSPRWLRPAEHLSRGQAGEAALTSCGSK